MSSDGFCTTARRPFKSGPVQTWLRNNALEVRERPPHSLDLNPMGGTDGQAKAESEK